MIIDHEHYFTRALGAGKSDALRAGIAHDSAVRYVHRGRRHYYQTLSWKCQVLFLLNTSMSN